MDDDRHLKRKKDKSRDDKPSRKDKSKKPRYKSHSPESRENVSSNRRRRSRSRSFDESIRKERQDESRSNEIKPKNEAPERKRKETDLLNTRTGGAYIPPARLRMMQAEITDKSSVAYQRLAWEALKKSIHGHINKINVGNIGIIIKELLKENIVRGRGLLCRSVIQAQAASPTFTNVYAALVAAVNSRFPNIGELLLKRLVIQFKRGFKRNDKPICISSASFIAHLVNQRVAHEILALELLTLLVETPTDDSVEVAIAFLKECGQKLTEVSSKGVNAIFEMLRNILHEGQLDKRVQYMIEVMFQVWKDGFKDHPALIEELELVPEEEQFTHLLMLDDATDAQDILNVFKFDEKFEENEQKYKTLSKEILGSDAESEEGDSGESGSEESDDEDEENEQKAEMTIIDNTETNLVALRRTIYLTINSSLDFEECAHKLMKMQLKPGQEVELCHMFLDCCAEQRTYEKFYGLLAQRFCNINRIYIGPFEEIFKDSYGTAHRLDTNRLRNVSKFFAHLLFTDSISWEVLECVKLNEEDTTSSSRIYIKILFQELAEYMGLKKLNDRLKDPTLQSAFSGVFPRDNPKNTRFSINFFTSIGLGGLTDELREHLKQMPKNVAPPITEIKVGSSSESSSSSSSSSDSSSSSEDSDSSDSDKETKTKKKDKDKSKKDQASKESVADKETHDKNDNSERWGHDGFYDTYGKDAHRLGNRDKGKFAVPQSKDNSRGSNQNRNFERTNGDYKRQSRTRDHRDDERRKDKNSKDKYTSKQYGELTHKYHGDRDVSSEVNKSNSRKRDAFDDRTKKSEKGIRQTHGQKSSADERDGSKNTETERRERGIDNNKSEKRYSKSSKNEEKGRKEVKEKSKTNQSKERQSDGTPELELHTESRRKDISNNKDEVRKEQSSHKNDRTRQRQRSDEFIPSLVSLGHRAERSEELDTTEVRKHKENSKNIDNDRMEKNDRTRYKKKYDNSYLDKEKNTIRRDEFDLRRKTPERYWSSGGGRRS